MLAWPPVTVATPSGEYGPGARWPTTAALGTAAPAAAPEGLAAVVGALALGLGALEAPPPQAASARPAAVSSANEAGLNIKLSSPEKVVLIKDCMAAALPYNGG